MINNKFGKYALQFAGVGLLGVLLCAMGGG
jgi:hypothetical protein